MMIGYDRTLSVPMWPGLEGRVMQQRFKYTLYTRSPMYNCCSHDELCQYLYVITTHQVTVDNEIYQSIYQILESARKGITQNCVDNLCSQEVSFDKFPISFQIVQYMCFANVLSRVFRSYNLSSHCIHFNCTCHLMDIHAHVLVFI